MKDPFKPEHCIDQLSIDCVIFGYQARQLQVLITNLKFNNDLWALPGGFILHEEGIDEAAARILSDRTGIENIYLEQFRVFGQAGRNNRQLIQQLLQRKPEGFNDINLDQNTAAWYSKRFISIGYYALVDSKKVIPRKSEIDKSIDWFPVQALPEMIMDHREITKAAHYALRRDLDAKLSAFNLLPPTFTMKDLRGLYESIYERAFVRSNFQKKMLDLNILERLGKQYTGAANKAPYLYRFKQQ